MKNKHRGFTIVELVIVIAVVAVLAAVLIPTFSSIIKKANISKDTQAVRNMNIILTSESAASVPANSIILKDLLKSNGITDFNPQTKFHSFFWIEDKNVIVLADEGDTPVYPEEYRTEGYNPLTWYALDVAATVDLPQRSDDADADSREPQDFTVTITQSGSSLYIPFENIPTVATGYEAFSCEISLPQQFREAPLKGYYLIQKVTAIMKNGATEHKIEVRSETAQEFGSESSFTFDVDEIARLEIPYVTGNIEINIDIAEFYVVKATYKPFEGDVNTREKLVTVHCMKKYPEFSWNSDVVKIQLDPKYKVKSAMAYRNGECLGEFYDAEDDCIRHDFGSTSAIFDFELIIEIEPRIYTVDVVIRNSKDKFLEQQIKVQGDSLTIDFDDYEIWGSNVQGILNNIFDVEDRNDIPRWKYDEETNEVTVYNIKSDFKWTCFVD